MSAVARRKSWIDSSSSGSEDGGGRKARGSSAAAAGEEDELPEVGNIFSTSTMYFALTPRCSMALGGHATGPPPQEEGRAQASSSSSSAGRVALADPTDLLPGAAEEDRVVRPQPATFPSPGCDSGTGSEFMQVRRSRPPCLTDLYPELDRDPAQGSQVQKDDDEAFWEVFWSSFGDVCNYSARSKSSG